MDDSLFEKNDNHEANTKSLVYKKRKLEEEIKFILESIKSLYLNKVKGNLSDDDFEKIHGSFLADKQTKEQDLNSVNNQIEAIALKQKNKEDLPKQKKLIIEKFRSFDTLTYEVINSFIDYIEIGEKTLAVEASMVTDKDSKSTKKNYTQNVVIHWNF